MKLPLESVEPLLSKLSAADIFWLVPVAILAWRSPLILREVLTHFRENKRVSATVDSLRRKTDLEIAQKIEKKERQRGSKQ
jgi:hypothetical protein